MLSVRRRGRSIHHFQTAHFERPRRVDAKRQACLDAVVAPHKARRCDVEDRRVACTRSDDRAARCRPDLAALIVPQVEVRSSAVAAAVFTRAGERDAVVPTSATAAIGVHIDVIRAVREQSKGFIPSQGAESAPYADGPPRAQGRCTRSRRRRTSRRAKSGNRRPRPTEAARSLRRSRQRRRWPCRQRSHRRRPRRRAARSRHPDRRRPRSTDRGPRCSHRLRSARIFGSISGRNAWPPKPGLTVITRTTSHEVQHVLDERDRAGRVQHGARLLAQLTDAGEDAVQVDRRRGLARHEQVVGAGAREVLDVPLTLTTVTGS